MSECLGLEVFGLCAYDPSDPPNIYFSIGEAIAALSITLIIPQFLRPIYRFRLATQAIRLSHIYSLVFLAAACVLTATILPNIDISRGSILAYPVFWEFVGGILFLVAFGALVFAVLRPASARRGAYPRFAQAAADFLAHASKQDQSDFSKDLLRNIESLIDVAAFNEFLRDTNAFFDFRYRPQIEDASYAWSLLQIVAEPQLCETLVHRCPWDTAAMIHRISKRRQASEAAEDFVREIGRQAIICPSSMMAREIGYKGFHAAPVLSQALFEDGFINRTYQPLSGLELGDLRDIDRNTLDRLFHGLRSTLMTVLAAGDYRYNRSLSRMANHLGWVALDVHRQVRADREDYDLVISIYRLLDVLNGIEEVLDWCGDQVDHGDEGGRVAVSTGPCSGRLKERVEAFDAGVIVG
jgi:hypothetical protein